MSEMPSVRKALFDGILFLLLLIILAVRSIYGLDLSDEMQYYGQIAALTSKGRLFETDLFIQQMVYVPFYPFFKFHEALFQQEGLVLFGRLLFAACLLTLFLYAKNQMRRLGGGFFESGMAALAITFAPSFHGIFAISYNTISQIAWVIFILWFVEWSGRHWWQWAILIVLTAFAHPVAALLMAVLLSIRLTIEQRLSDLLLLLVRLALIASLALAILSCFTSWQNLFDAFVFSKGFAVGSQLLSDYRQWFPACVFVLLLFVLNLAPIKWMKRVTWSWGWRVVSLVGIGILLIRDHANGYTVGIALMTSTLVLLGLARLRAGIEPRETLAMISLRWLSLSIAAQFLSLVITSSNGLGQGTGAMLVALPLLLTNLRLFSPITSVFAGKSRPFGFAETGLIVALFVTHWCVTPYRDDRWYKPSSLVSGIPEFAHIKTSLKHAVWLQTVQEQFAGSMHGKNALIVSEKPALYFALGAVPQTCMLYMHSIGAAKASKVLTSCMDRRNPFFVFYVHPDLEQPDRTRHVRDFATDFASRNEMTCLEGSVISAKADFIEGESILYMLCHR